MTAHCTTCEADTPTGITLCHECTTRLEYDLAEVDNVWEDLQTTAERMDKGAASVGGGGPSGSRPPCNLDALDKGQTLRVILGGWASNLPGLRPVKDHDGLLVTRLASWLLTQIPTIRKQDWAGDLQRELREALNDCRKATDRAADRISLGPCPTVLEGIPCPDTVTAIVGAVSGRCRTCGGTVNVKTHQQWVISEAWHVAAPLPVIIRALRTCHIFIQPKDAENWAARGKLMACIAEDGSKTYQLKQAHAVHKVMAAKRAATQARREERKALTDAA